MLYWLLSPEQVGVALFRYQTFRAAFAAITAFALALALGHRFIAWLRQRGALEDVAKTDSAELAALRAIKKSTPTMGGVLILGCVLASTLLWARLDEPYVWGAIAVVVALGAIGIADDWIKLTHARRHGLSSKEKFLAILLLGLVVALALAIRLSVDGPDAPFELQLPFFKGVALDLSLGHGAAYLALVTLVILSSANAVNLTDGLDGLAIGCTILVALTLMVYSYVAGRADYTRYLALAHVPGAGELAVVCGALIGAGLGFLWFNCFPAQVFMGDTGSLPLGGVLGYVAVVTRQELMLVLIGGIFVLEAVSVILQVGSFKLRGVRVFRCAPLHHHFEFGGVPEPKVTVRFWIVAAMLAMFGMASLKLR